MTFADQSPSRPQLTLPPPVARFVQEKYSKAKVILEYGSGGSTVIAAEQPGTVVYSVESDKAWIEGMARWFEHNPPKGTVHLHHVDIGPTREWGYPVDERKWRNFIDYPLSVWDRPDMLPPDLVLIDGRFRVGCFLAAISNITRPTTVLFDDYGDRPQYHVVEQFSAPVEMVDRMARFELAPRAIHPRELHKWINLMQRLE